jgi:hypothetical protein
MTIVEFLFPVKSFSLRDISIAALYFEKHFNGKEALTVDELRSSLEKGRIPKAKKVNIADVLSKGSPYVHTAGDKGKAFLWAITETGENHVRKILKIPESSIDKINDTTILQTLASSISNPIISDYIFESLNCLSIGALRASVVFLWTGSIRSLQESMLSKGVANVNIALQKHDPKSRNVKTVDDFAYIKDSIAILAAQDLGIIDKNQRTTLEEALNLRNRCGHPSKYKPGEKKVSSFIEDIINVLFK